MAELETEIRNALERRLAAMPARPDLRARISPAVLERKSEPQAWRVVAGSAALLLVGAVTFYFLLARHIPPAPIIGPTPVGQSPTPTASAIASPTASVRVSPTPQASSSLGGPAAVQPIDTPPPGVAGRYALQFQLNLAGSVNPGDKFQVSFHPPTSASGNQITFNFCPNFSGNPSTGPSGPCQTGATYMEGGGFQPIGSVIAYKFTRASSSGTTEVIAQGTETLNMNEALVVVYSQSS